MTDTTSHPIDTASQGASTGMLSAEFYKLRAHRTPLAIFAVVLLGVLAPSAVLAFYTPDSATAYNDIWTTVFELLGPLTAIVFGSWLIGTEYKQGTLKRMLTTEPRRARAIGAKATAGVVATVAGLATVAVTGFGAAWLVGNLNDTAVTWDSRQILAAIFTSLVSAAIGFALSTVTRNAAFGMVAGIGMLLVFDPLLSLIPTVGDYTLGSVLGIVDSAISGTESAFETASLATSTAVITLGAWMALLGGAAARLFMSRDV